MARSTVEFQNADFAEFCHAAGHNDFAALSALADSGTSVATSRSTRVSRYRLHNQSTEWDIHIKHFRYSAGRGRSHWPLDKARIEARNSRIIAENSPFCVPTVLALGCRRDGIRLIESLLITRTLTESESLAEVAARGTLQYRATLKKMLCQLATGLRRLHDAGFVHIDLQPRNVLLQRTSTGTWKLALIDSTRGGLRNDPIRLAHGRLRDLSGLYKGLRHCLSTTDIVRYYLAYAGKPRLDDGDRLTLLTILADRAIKDHDVLS